MTARASTLLSKLDNGSLSREGRLEAIVDLLCEFLPIDAVRRDEAIVWIEFQTAARTDESLAETSRRAAAQTARMVEVIVESAQRRGTLAANIDLVLETARLTALIDGLTLRCALHPDMDSASVARDALTLHLRTLMQQRSGAHAE
ncbi:TetR family transcriptional regulator [Prauserella rugosa]|uniref:TetR family transcriptional regulator n=1 Tax=Prauserella rugosa TaxID=43354 RepID=A0A660CGG6_9PSEU|nr:TetR family transcriptional regulator [Prauserella rugosa]